MSRIFLSGILAGIVMFIWSAISWTLLPWHHWTINQFKNAAEVGKTIQANAPTSGIYLLHTEETANQPSSSPFIFASVAPDQMSSMVPYLLGGLLIQILAALLISILVSLTQGLSYSKKVGFVVLFGLAAFVATELPYWNWFHFSTSYTLITLIDFLIECFLGGLVIAKIIKH